MGRRGGLRIVGVVAMWIVSPAPLFALPDVDLAWRPQSFNAAPGQPFDVDLVAILTRSGTRNIEAVQAIVTWDPTRLELTDLKRPCGTCTSGSNDGAFCTENSQCPGSACGGSDACFDCPSSDTYNWLSAAFPNDCAQGDALNAPCPGFPTNDGMAFFTAFVQILCNGESADPAVVTPSGLRIATLEFTPLIQTGGALIDLVLSTGQVSNTLVAAGDPDPGANVLRQIGPAAQVTVVQCQPPQLAEATGSRYMTVSPPPGTASVALLVNGNPGDSVVGCVNEYVQAPIQMCVGGFDHRQPCTSDADCANNGSCKRFAALGPDPVRLTPAEWGNTIAVRGAAIQPSRQYTMRSDCGVAAGENLSTALPVDTWFWGDIDHDGACRTGTNNGTPCDRDDQCTGGGICDAVDFLDIGLTVDGFKGRFSAIVTMTACDLGGSGCVPNLDINFIDIGFDVEAFKRRPFSCGFAVCP